MLLSVFRLLAGLIAHSNAMISDAVHSASDGMYWYTRYYAEKIDSSALLEDAMDKMIDQACDEETEKQIYDCVMENENVLGIDLLQTRIFGNKIYVDVEIQVDGSYTLQAAHNIAEAVHENIEQNFSKIKHIMVHVNPVEGRERRDTSPFCPLKKLWLSQQIGFPYLTSSYFMCSVFASLVSATPAKTSISLGVS